MALCVAIATVVVMGKLPNIGDIIEPLGQLTAASAYLAIKTIGLPVTLDKLLLIHPDGFRFAISYGCTPLVPAVFLGLLLTLGMPLTSRERVIGITSGILLITLLNLCRLTALYYTGIVAPEKFSVAHEWLGQGVIILGTAAIAMYWIAISANKQQRPEPVQV